ncbi:MULTISPECIES: hypothetical protein [unclassified Roseibium]|uniref:hypothetical protein n=1 Tax=unclassified Roseibium TaxID=2629323 RepID=UPI00273ED73F|nr:MULTISPECIES: hypothetical protein [unclassified Roseibium]
MSLQELCVNKKASQKCSKLPHFRSKRRFSGGDATGKKCRIIFASSEQVAIFAEQTGTYFPSVE